MNKPISTYRNEKYGFEIVFPAGWAVTSSFSRLPVILSNNIQNANILEEFSNNAKEYLNIVVEEMVPEIPPDIVELIFTINARKINYTDVMFSRITIEGRAHTCTSYIMMQSAFLKKYSLVLNGYGYALTASCPLQQRNLKIEETWDGIAKSFRLLSPIRNSVIAINNSPQARNTIELLRQMLKKNLEEQS